MHGQQNVKIYYYALIKPEGDQILVETCCSVMFSARNMNK